MIQNRNIAVYVILSIFTCGLFGIYWFIVLTNDTNSLIPDDQPKTSGVVAFLLSIVTCTIYYFYWMYKQGEKIDYAKSQRGMGSSSNGIIYLILALFNLSIVSYALMQNELNKLA